MKGEGYSLLYATFVELTKTFFLEIENTFES